MKIPDAEMPKRYTFDQTGCCDGAIEERPNGEWVSFSAYQRLYNERRFIPVEKCSPWVSVKDRLPEDGDSVIFAHHNGVSSGMYSTFGGDAPFEEPDGYTYRATHWMPLPNPPETA